MNGILMLCTVLAFALQAYGQTTYTYTTDTEGQPPIPTVQSNLSTTLMGVVIESWHYDPVQKTLTLHLVNHSHKDVTAFNISFAEKYTDGSTNPWYAEGIPHNLQDSQRMEDMLGSLLAGQHKAFAAGTARDYVLSGEQKDVADIEAVVDVVAYADGTADVLNNDRAFRNLVAERKGPLLAMQKVNDVVKRVLADPMVSDPISAALNELLPFAESLDAKTKNGSPEVAENNVARNLQNEIRNLQYMQREKTDAQRDSLARYVVSQEMRIALMAPHANLSVNVSDAKR